MKSKNIIYAICMIVFAVLAFVFFDRGFNVRTRNLVRYQEKGDITYKVYLNENNIYKKDYLNMGERYIAKYVDNIKVTFGYNNLYNNYINGYYGYKSVGILTIKDSDGVLFKNDYTLKTNNIKTLNENNMNEIKILDNVVVDYNYYNNIYKQIVGNKSNVSGNLEVNFIMDFNIDFTNISNIVKDEKVMSVIIPLGVNDFRIDINTNYNGIGYYDDYEDRGKVNFFLLIVGAFLLSLSIAFLGLIIRAFVMIYEKKTKYEMAMSKILSEYDDIIVKVNRFYNKKKYNLIYVNDFDELIDVYKKVGSPISYRELKRGYESIFLLIDDDNAWIYRMVFE